MRFFTAAVSVAILAHSATKVSANEDPVDPSEMNDNADNDWDADGEFDDFDPDEDMPYKL